MGMQTGLSCSVDVRATMQSGLRVATWHVGGPHGWEVNRIPNGQYQYCVQAITINGVKSHRCTPVTVRHS
jgi:hypothetical protein